MIDITSIPAPRVAFIDPRTGLMAREWYRFFLNLFTLTGGGASGLSITDLAVAPAMQAYDEAIIQGAYLGRSHQSDVTQFDPSAYCAPANASLGTASAVNVPITLSNGGTGATLTASVGGIVYSGAAAFAVLAGTATAGQMLRSGASAAPTWSTATWPDTITINQVPYATAANVIGSSAGLTFDGTTFTGSNVVGTTTVKVGTAGGYLASDGSTGATGSFTTADLKTVTVTDGIVTSIV